MTDIELYREIGTWMNRYHRRSWYHTGLLKDFQHDLWLSLVGKAELSLNYIKRHCYLYPGNAMRYKYYKREKDFSQREIVLLDSEGVVVSDFADNSFNPEYEFPLPEKPKLRHHKDTKRLKVLYRNDTEEEFDSVAALAKELGTTRNTVYRQIGKPLAGRFTKRKMSHIKIINYAD